MKASIDGFRKPGIAKDIRACKPMDEALSHVY